MKKKKCLVSACLAGINCRYDGGSKLNPSIARLVMEGVAIAVCPEQLGGLGVPRLTADLEGGVGMDVLNGKARVLNSEDNDVTDFFLAGAREILAVARRDGVTLAILKENSPSCGCLRTYVRNTIGFGERSSRVQGQGVTAALLSREGMRLISDEEWGQLSELEQNRLFD